MTLQITTETFEPAGMPFSERVSLAWMYLLGAVVVLTNDALPVFHYNKVREEQ